MKKNSLLYSELILKSSELKISSGYYTCSLTFTRTGNGTNNVRLTRNQSIIFRPTIKPTYPSFADQILTKQPGDMWTDSCSASGWPLPLLHWTLNGRLVANHSDAATPSIMAMTTPYAITHHRNLTVTAFVIAQNLSSSSGGKYTCWLEGVTPIKNVSLIVRGGGQSPQPLGPNDRSDMDDIDKCK